MTDTTAGGRASPGRLKVKFKLAKVGPDPTGLSSWEVYARRWLLVDVHLGYLNANGRDHAMELARAKWPHERRIVLHPRDNE